jgi:hypothetical protein
MSESECFMYFLFSFKEAPCKEFNFLKNCAMKNSSKTDWQQRKSPDENAHVGACLKTREAYRAYISMP